MLWSMMANPDECEFLIDLDYIFKWVKPSAVETYYKFWVAPATMVFENVFGVNIDIESSQGSIEIVDLHKGHPELTLNGRFTSSSYWFECQEGEISLRATSYKMFVRQKPKLLQRQSLLLSERGGISFAKEFSITL